ncbi:hypothetical protein DPMN_094466 [Dreissena polymorpha]|uniref:Uncharacterized protein n=1 Tax=Dreissena polymorpha TaxID=45954 RepID=A0A9D4L4T4_DREPO|nr:hypothetical protein DPMN_094466 [Dreissena polymorpha]
MEEIIPCDVVLLASAEEVTNVPICKHLYTGEPSTTELTERHDLETTVITELPSLLTKLNDCSLNSK